jgi:uncharacterized membrane protein YesL
MNWLTNHFLAEGPGIPKDAPKPEGLRLLAFVLGREWWTLLKLNLLFVAFALPLFTIPAAWFATVSISVTMIEDRNVWLLKDFWAAFRSRFALSSALGLAFLGAGALCILAVRTYASAVKDNLLFAPPLMMAIAVSVLLLLYGAHLFVALALGHGRPFGDLAKAAVLGLLARPLPGILALLIVGALWIVHIAFYPASVFMPVLVNFSLGALVLSFATIKGVRFGFSRLAADTRHEAARGSETQSA